MTEFTPSLAEVIESAEARWEDSMDAHMYDSRVNLNPGSKYEYIAKEIGSWLSL